MSSKAAVSFSYAVFTFQVDESGALTVPIGVALWSPERQWAAIRLVGEKERLKQFKSKEHYPFVSLVSQKIDRWRSQGTLPYLERQVEPSTDEWWRHVRELLIHRVRLSEPRPIDCRDPEEELEPLYESVVSAHLFAREQRIRIDGRISKCLDGLARKFQSRQELNGFGGRPVRVLRSYHGTAGWVVIEGVNLASPRADTETDATVSRLLRLREGQNDGRTEILVGYLASPEGLNGESVLVEWISRQTEAKVFDLVKERADFRQTAERMLASVDEHMFP